MTEFTRAGAGLPHDLRHLVVERELSIADGIWGGIAAGMVYTSMNHVRGRRPPHSADRSAELIRVQRHRLGRAELFANLAEAIAKLADPSPDEIRRLTRAQLSVVPVVEPGADPAAIVALPSAEALLAAARALQLAAARWARLRPGEELVYEWRLPVPAEVRHVPRAVPRQREAAVRRDPPRTGRRGPRQRARS